MPLFRKFKIQTRILLCLCLSSLGTYAQQSDTLQLDSISQDSTVKQSFQFTHLIPVYSHLQYGKIPQAIAYGAVHAGSFAYGFNQNLNLNKLRTTINNRINALAIDSTLEFSSPFYQNLNAFYATKFRRNLSFGVFGLSLVHSFVTARNHTAESIHLALPTKRAMASAAIPGLGQVMNGKLWKLPIVYGALGACVYFTSQNLQQYQKFQTLTVLLEKNKQFELQQFYTFYNAQDGIDYTQVPASSAAQYSAFYKKNLDNLVLATIGVYALQILDAFVDAHFQGAPKDITISENRLSPIGGMDIYSGQYNFGFQYRF